MPRSEWPTAKSDVDRALRNGFIEGNPERAEEGE